MPTCSAKRYSRANLLLRTNLTQEATHFCWAAIALADFVMILGVKCKFFIIALFTFILNQRNRALPREMSVLTQQCEFRGMTNEMSYVACEKLGVQLDLIYLFFL